MRRSVEATTSAIDRFKSVTPTYSFLLLIIIDPDFRYHIQTQDMAPSSIIAYLRRCFRYCKGKLLPLSFLRIASAGIQARPQELLDREAVGLKLAQLVEGDVGRRDDLVGGLMVKPQAQLVRALPEIGPWQHPQG